MASMLAYEDLKPGIELAVLPKPVVIGSAWDEIDAIAREIPDPRGWKIHDGHLGQITHLRSDRSLDLRTIGELTNQYVQTVDSAAERVDANFSTWRMMNRYLQAGDVAIQDTRWFHNDNNVAQALVVWNELLMTEWGIGHFYGHPEDSEIERNARIEHARNGLGGEIELVSFDAGDIVFSAAGVNNIHRAFVHENEQPLRHLFSAHGLPN